MTSSTDKVRMIIVSVVMIGFALSQLVTSATAKSNKPQGTAATSVGKADPGNGSSPTSTSNRPGSAVIMRVKRCTTIAVCVPNFFSGGQTCQNQVSCP
jgi:hypothetical protein